MQAIAFILVLVAIIGTVFYVAWSLLGGMLGPSFNRFNPFLSRSAYAPDPTCGQCGYPSRGISTFECPECGADLREVGIKTPEMRHAMRGGSGAGCVLPVVWTLGVLFGGTICGNIIRGLAVSSLRTEYRAELIPNSSAYSNLGLLVEYKEPTPRSYGMGSYSNYWGTPSSHLELATSPRTNSPSRIEFEFRQLPAAGSNPTQPSHFEIDCHHSTFRFEKSPGVWENGQGFPSGSDFLEWFVVCGLSKQDPRVAIEAAEVAQLVDALDRKHRAYPLTQFTTYGSNDQYWIDEPSHWYQVAFFVFWFFLWLAGLCFLNTHYPNKNLKKLEPTP